MKSAELLGITIGIATISGIVIKFLVSDWYKKAKEIEKLKAEQTKNLLDRFKRDIDALCDKMRRFEQKLTETDKHIYDLTYKSEKVMQIMEKALISARNISDELDGKIRDKVRSEVIKLKDDLILMKGHKK